MPGVNPPNSEFFLRQLIELKRQFDGLVTNQQMVFTNASDQMIVATGLIPGQNPAVYGIAGFSGASGIATFAMYETVIPDGSGRRQTVTGIQRDDGTVALWCADLGTVPNHPHQQALQWFDRSFNVVIADDTVSGVGVARPHIPSFALMNTNTTSWPSTTATSATTISACYMEYQQPKIQWVINCYSPPSVTAVFALQYNGTQIGTTTVAGGSGGNLFSWSGVAAVPAGLTFGTVYPLQLLAHLTVGTGTVYAQSLLIQGQGS